jgi:hypothetical protein
MRYNLRAPAARLAGGFAVAMIGMVAAATSVFADESVNTGYFGGVAIMGYDPVAYFTDNRAVQGSEDISYDWLGTAWHFASPEHKAMFASDPIKYAPQYGGYCAAEVVAGSVTIDIDPEAFKIIDGKLYLIYDKAHADEFASHASENLKLADSNWPKIKAKLELSSYH